MLGPCLVHLLPPAFFPSLSLFPASGDPLLSTGKASDLRPIEPLPAKPNGTSSIYLRSTIYIYINMYIYIYVYMCICVYIYVCIYVSIHIYIYIYYLLERYHISVYIKTGRRMEPKLISQRQNILCSLAEVAFRLQWEFQTALTGTSVVPLSLEIEPGLIFSPIWVCLNMYRAQ